jgi:hypothetical protein
MLLREIHNVPYVGHPCYYNIIAVVKSQHFWLGIKKEAVDIAKCLECQKFKVEHKHPTSLLQP